MTTKDRYNGIQSAAEIIGKYGCHFLVLLSIAEEERERLGFNNPNIDLIEAFWTCTSKGYLRASDCYVKNCLAILNIFTGKTWSRVQLEKLPSVINGNEYTECNWYNPKTKREHFTRRGFDTISESITRKEGSIRYYYLYTCKED